MNIAASLHLKISSFRDGLSEYHVYNQTALKPFGSIFYTSAKISFSFHTAPIFQYFKLEMAANQVETTLLKENPRSLR
jgi:hypothetical protein